MKAMLYGHQNVEEAQLPPTKAAKNHERGSATGLNRAADQKPTIRILAVGDSLTAGLLHQSDLGKLHPYTITLEEKLRQDYGELFEFDVHNQGISGICASDLLEHLHYREPKLFDQGWDVILVLVGTNDIGMHKKPETITNDLNAIYEWLANLPTRPTLLVMSIPNCCATVQWIHDNRSQVNTWIEAYVTKGNASGDLGPTGLFFLDLF